jgi:RNA polymerase sigma-70 factor (ECF subfamily)
MGITATELARCFDDYAAGLVLYARQWAGAGLAEDMVQEGFVRLAAQREMPANPRAWLLVTVRHAALDARKSARRREIRDAAMGRSAFLERRSTAEDWLNDAEAQAALAELPAAQREAVVLRIWNGANFQEMAELMRMPLSTVYAHYQAALDSLRKKWGLPCKETKCR